MGKTKLTQILLKLEPETLARLDALVKSSGKTRMTIVREALANFLADHDLNAEREAVRRAYLGEAVQQAYWGEAVQQADWGEAMQQADWGEAMQRAYSEAQANTAAFRKERAERIAAQMREAERLTAAARRARSAHIPHVSTQRQKLPPEKRQAKLAEEYKLRHRRLRKIHPDKLGREQTAEERVEYTRLSRRRKK
jgi:predicted DNA-binding protein